MPRKSAPNAITKRDAREIERRQLLVAEADRVGPAQHVVAEQLEGDRRRRAEPVRNSAASSQPAAAAAAASGTPATSDRRPRRARRAARRARAIASSQRDRLELAGAARAAALHRLRQPIGVIGDLNRRLPARAESALVDRMLRLALRASSRRPSSPRPAARCGPSRRRLPSRGPSAPQPALHNGHTLGFHSATPGTRSSSGTKRMS